MAFVIHCQKIVRIDIDIVLGTKEKRETSCQFHLLLVEEAKRTLAATCLIHLN